MLQAIIDRHIASIKAASTEVDFWTRFEGLSQEVGAYPNGLAVLWTPSCAMAGFGPTSKPKRLEEFLGDDDLVAASRCLSPTELGNIRRAVRCGVFVISVRDTARQWNAALDSRGLKIGYSDPMLSGRELGLC